MEGEGRGRVRSCGNYCLAPWQAGAVFLLIFLVFCLVGAEGNRQYQQEWGRPGDTGYWTRNGERVPVVVAGKGKGAGEVQVNIIDARGRVLDQWEWTAKRSDIETR